MEYIIVKQAAEKWELKVRRVQQLCEEGRIPGAIRPARDWLIPKDAKKPDDSRLKKYRKKDETTDKLQIDVLQ